MHEPTPGPAPRGRRSHPRLPARPAVETFTLAPPAELALSVAPGRDGQRPTAGRAGRGIVPALLGVPVDDAFIVGTVRCDACAHRCVLRVGRVGICGVRENRAGQLVSTVHGEAAAVHVEPIEKKPLYHFLPGSLALSLATRGCNLHCDFCQNWELAQGHRAGIVPRAEPLPPEAVVVRALDTGARTIAYTYVEPTVFLEYALDTARLARQAGLRNVFVTNGYQTPEALDLIAPVLDAANVDLKSFSDATYRRICGARLEPVRETLTGLKRAGIWVEVTTLLVPGVNDGTAEVEAMAEWIGSELGAETPWHLSRFYPANRMAAFPPTPAATLERAADAGRRAGLAHVYLGNAPELHDEETRCAGCGRWLIRRRDFAVVGWALVDGRCPDCYTHLAGVGLNRPAAVTG